MDIKTERRHYLNVPMVTRYIRIHPLTWRKRIGLRAGVIGCKHSGDCGPGKVIKSFYFSIVLVEIRI